MLSKSMEALPPMAAAVLVAVAGEEVVEKFVDVNKHFLVMLGDVEEGVGRDCSHLCGLAEGDGSHRENCRRQISTGCQIGASEAPAISKA